MFLELCGFFLQKQIYLVPRCLLYNCNLCRSMIEVKSALVRVQITVEKATHILNRSNLPTSIVLDDSTQI